MRDTIPGILTDGSSSTVYLKPRKASTDPRLRSLLQKAVRRGSLPVVERVVTRLDSIGDSTWLRSRTVVITFEEAWPLGGLVSIDRSLSSKLDVLRFVTQSPKQKDAAGLGALAYAYSGGDTSTLSFVPDKRTLRIVAAALERPKDFFEWLIQRGNISHGGNIILAAERYFRVATWNWDKACILGGAFLAQAGDIPRLIPKREAPSPADFPYWVALDKHTDEGKVVLKAVAKATKVSYRQLIWASFYCESAVVNELLPSPWFGAECDWRLARAKLNRESAEELWSQARPMVRERLQVGAQRLKDLLDLSPVPRKSLPPKLL
jgi:hypothetical protein